MPESIQKSAKKLQTCERCLKHQPATNHIVSCETSLCFSSCDNCLQLKSVCENCKESGHTSYITSLRACNKCLDEGLTCHRFVVLVVETDCEECNKKTLLTLESMAIDGTLLVELSLLVALPVMVHLGNSLKCTLANSFINLRKRKAILS